VIVDIYAGIAVVQLLIKGTERLSGCLVEALESVGIRKVFLKNKENSLRLENVEMINGWISREISQESLVQISENGLKFRVDFRKGQKTGFFLDQRDNRRLLGQYAKGKRVLNSFCYTGGFSVYALAQGAVSVHSVDVSKEALGLCRENVELNFGTISSGAHEVFAEDCFDYLRDTTQAYDIIVLDPPAFAKNAKSVPNACRGYKGLNLAAFQKIERGGIVFTFSCSKSIDKELFRKIVFGAAADAGRNIRILHQLSQPPDHPINIFHPESEYLKGLVLYVE